MLRFAGSRQQPDRAAHQSRALSAFVKEALPRLVPLRRIKRISQAASAMGEALTLLLAQGCACFVGQVQKLCCASEIELNMEVIQYIIFCSEQLTYSGLAVRYRVQMKLLFTAVHLFLLLAGAANGLAENGCDVDRSLNPRVRSVQPSKTMTISDLATSMREAGADMISLAAGEPDFETPDAVIQAGIEAMK